MFAKYALMGACAALSTFFPATAQSMIRDIVDVEGVRGNDLVGYGVVVGLSGTGDSVRNAPFTEDSLTHLLERLGVNVQGEAIKPKNVAAVLVTATLPAFARKGSRIDIAVASIGDAESLAGGTLILTPLKGANNEVYAVAQGSIIVAGYAAKGAAARETRGTVTSAAIPNGARVEKEVGYTFNDQDTLTLALRNPDFTTAGRIEDAINTALGKPVAAMQDPGTVTLNLQGQSQSPARILARIETLAIDVDVPARIVIDEKSGAIVFGEDVSISRVAIAQGNITIKISERPLASQPNPFSSGETILVPSTDIDIVQSGTDAIAELSPNVTLSQLVAGLNALGVPPQEIADIIRAMKAAGAVHADLIVR
jgi:flagellar P-ring protein FlgI